MICCALISLFVANVLAFVGLRRPTAIRHPPQCGAGGQAPSRLGRATAALLAGTGGLVLAIVGGVFCTNAPLAILPDGFGHICRALIR
jgi:hypothetical protein